MSNPIDKLGVKTSKWFRAKFPTAALEFVVSHPWARTWKITDKDQVYFLKQIREEAPIIIASTQAIATIFQDTVPAVIMSKPNLSLIVVADHGGVTLKSRSKNMEAVLTTYASLQVAAIKNTEHLSCVPWLSIESLYPQLLKFLGDSACDYMGEQRAKRYHSLFCEIAPIVEPIIETASKLPYTLNHCDLRPPNMAQKPEGSIAIFDWDDAKWGPLGLSLHAQFSGCLRPYLALSTNLDQSITDQAKIDRKHLDTYINTLVVGGVGDAESLRKNLPAGVVIGTINYILGFEKCPTSSASTKKSIARNITKRLQSILDFVEASSSTNQKSIEHLAHCYFKYSFERGLIRLQRRFDRPLIDRPNLNSDALENSRKLGIFPKTIFSDIELDNRVCTDENASLSAQIYKEQGVVLLENTISVELIKACRRYFFEQYKMDFEHQRPDDSLRVGKKRFMMTLPLEGPFNQSDLYANPIIMRIMKRILGDNFILGSMVVVTSLPGSQIQSRHRDHHALFREEELALPPFAVSVMIPLIDMDEEVGATRVFKGSHLQPTNIASEMPGQDPVVPVGSCFLMDYRVQHRGMPNLSKDKIRPVVTLIFQRPWFRDYVNYDNQERMIIADNELEKVPREHRHLFDWK